MERGSTYFLRGVIGVVGIAATILAGFLVWEVVSKPVGIYLPIIVGTCVALTAFFMALYQGIKLLGYIDSNQAFSDLSVSALKHIKNCALTIGVIYTFGMPYIYLAAQEDDAPGVILIGLVVIFASLIVTTFAAVLQKLLQNAILLKTENDLTV